MLPCSLGLRGKEAEIIPCPFWPCGEEEARSNAPERRCIDKFLCATLSLGHMGHDAADGSPQDSIGSAGRLVHDPGRLTRVFVPARRSHILIIEPPESSPNSESAPGGASQAHLAGGVVTVRSSSSRAHQNTVDHHQRHIQGVSSDPASSIPRSSVRMLRLTPHTSQQSAAVCGQHIVSCPVVSVSSSVASASRHQRRQSALNCRVGLACKLKQFRLEELVWPSD